MKKEKDYSTTKLDIDDPFVISAIKKLDSKQSTTCRTTFNLTAEAIEVLKNLSKKLGKTQKEILDAALEFTKVHETFRDDLLKTDKFSPKNSTKRVRRTFVINESIIVDLKKICSQSGISRDLFLDRLVIFYNMVLNALDEIQKKSYQKSLDLISGLLSEAEEIETNLRKIPLIENDVLMERYSIIVTQMITLVSDMKDYIKEGIEIKPW